MRGAIWPILGIGELAVYDIATRVGAFLGLAPDKVYLHAGTAEGARVFGVRSKPWLPVEREVFPKPLANLPAADIENLLCIYKARLRRVVGRATTAGHSALQLLMAAERAP